MNLARPILVFTALPLCLSLASQREAHGKETRPPKPADEASAKRPEAREKPEAFKDLPVIIPLRELPPMRSVRERTQQELEDRSQSTGVRIQLSTRPQGARVYYGRTLLGVTPLTLPNNDDDDTPLDVVISVNAFMKLRTRVRRKRTRKYFYKLHPAKL